MVGGGVDGYYYTVKGGSKMRVNKKKEHILDAAEALMCGIPDKDISVEMIAGKAGIAKGSIYYYFDSKDDIVNAVIERSYAIAINEYFADSNDASDPLSKIKSLFRSVLRQEFCDKRKNIILLPQLNLAGIKTHILYMEHERKS